MKKKVFILATPFVLLLVLVAVFWFVLGRQTASLLKPPEHGVRFTIQAETSAAKNANEIAELENAIRKRFARFGVRIFWEPVSETRFRVYAPIVNRAAIDEATALVSRRGRLELRLVHVNSRELVEAGELPDGFELLTHKVSRPFNKDYSESYLVSRRAEGGPAGIRVSQAMADQIPATGAYEISFKLQPDSAEAFRQITRDNVGRQLAIVVDGMLLAAPVIRSEIPGGAAVISGAFDKQTAAQLASSLETPLPFGVELLESKSF